MPFKYKLGQILVSHPFSSPTFIRVEKRTAHFLTLVPLVDKAESDPAREDWGHYRYFLSTPTDEVEDSCGHFAAGRYKIHIDKNGDETNTYGLDLWDGKAIPWTWSNDS